ncbi:hypothetical protein IMSHALPRED_001178 [Imshaugia aleurites]|uniref:F-box domain-containing protein n=1 Tax=Imshaugia aleurites TaxID=172621 RepID=A0A8H3J1R0_9LECA|nr:hypothetical protein IMSHALPRED_001178 [Imshaugia aleurites]
MASAPTIHSDGTFFPLLNLPQELRHSIFRFALPPIIAPRKFSSKMLSEDQDQRKPCIALFLINKQIHEEVSSVLYRYSHFLISINSARAACVALESPILLRELDHTVPVSVKMASSIRHVAVDLEWAEREIPYCLCLDPLLNVVCDHLRAFPCLQTLTVGWKKNGESSSGPRVGIAIFILGSLEKLQADLPHVQFTVEVSQQIGNDATGHDPNDLLAYVKLHNYISELRGKEKHLDTVERYYSQ